MRTKTISPISSDRMTQLEQQLEGSAFRHGTSAFRYGLIPEAPSDHLPITAFVNPTAAPPLNLMSWNLLADSHLYNNFMNISGSSLLGKSIMESGQDNLYFSSSSNMLYHFFSELSQFLYKKRAKGNITIDESLLKSFVRLDAQPCRLARSRNPETAKQKAVQAEKSRQQIMGLFLNHEHEYAGEFKLAIKHSLELIHHILGENGALQWKNRFQCIANNLPLQLKMQRMDFICLQECSSPKDMQNLLNTLDDRYTVLTHQTDARGDDHCAILYDKKKYVLEKSMNYNIEGKKPAIFARFHPIEKKEQAFVIASIHYPGGEHKLTQTLIEQIDSLKKDSDEKIEYFMLGDYNHTADFFKDTPKDINSLFPDTGTMAGSDYGNTNKAIDGVCTNIATDKIDISQLNLLPTAAPAETNLNIEFDLMPLVSFKENRQPAPMAAPNMSLFGYVVQNIVNAEKARYATDLLGSSQAKVAPKIKL